MELLKFIVTDVITATNIGQDKLAEIYPQIENQSMFAHTRLKLDDSKEYFLVAPRNSVLGVFPFPDQNGKSGTYVVYPFFSSHISLPIKPGEKVWVIEYDDEYYWLSRVHEADFVEDTNYTHSDRRVLSTIQGALELEDPSAIISEIPNFQNGEYFSNRRSEEFTVDSIESDLLKEGIDPYQFSLKNIDGYEKSIEESLASNAIFFESVPRFTKRPGDLTLHGSNNTAIILGTSRGYSKEKRPSPERSSTNAFPENDHIEKLDEGMGAIDIVAGRGRFFDLQENQKDKEVQNTQVKIIKNSRNVFESHKASGLNEELVPNGSALDNIPEGDPDMFYDASRVYLTMKDNPDALFGLEYPDLSAIQAPQSFDGDASIIAKSDHIRIVGRKDDDNNINGSIRIIKEGSEEDRGVIMIEPDGTIMIDGPRIIIGTGKESNNGEGQQVFIGRDASEPVVLGNQLVEILTEFLTTISQSSSSTYIGNMGGPLVTPIPEASQTLLEKLQLILSKNAKTR